MISGRCLLADPIRAVWRDYHVALNSAHVSIVDLVRNDAVGMDWKYGSDAIDHSSMWRLRNTGRFAHAQLLHWVASDSRR